MERLDKNIIEILFGKMIEERDIEIMGFKKPLRFEIYDGYAYCPNYKGGEYEIDFPRMKLVEESKEFQEDIRKWMKLDENDTITYFHIVQTFNELYKDCTGIEWSAETKKWVERHKPTIPYTKAA